MQDVVNGFTCATVDPRIGSDPSRLSNFCKAKGKKSGAGNSTSPYQTPKEQTMEYLILLGVVSMMALYALIIVGCMKQPEW